MRDERIYPNADQFKPERFTEEVDEETEKRRDPRNYVFGFGRRFVHARSASLVFTKLTDTFSHLDAAPEQI